MIIKLTKADLVTAILIAAFLPLYYKARFLLEGLIGWQDLLHPTIFIEYLFSTVLGFGLAAFHRGFSRSTRQGFVLVTIASAGSAIAFTLFFYTVVFPYGVQSTFLFDVAILALFVPLVISGVSDRVLLSHRADQAEQAALRERYASLKSRMSPHFLFNSLSTLTDIIEEDPELAVRFVEQVAFVYRYLIENQYTQRIGLDREVDAARALLFVMEARNPGALDVSISLPDKIDRFQTAPLAVQSLIENALKHNRYTPRTPLMLSLRIDAGDLIVENTIISSAAKETPGTGLADLSERIEFLTGERLSYQKENGRFCVRVPLIEVDDP